ncbi:BspA family leucine-rich repeat surface protein [Dyadobacter fermentans]|uniref:Lipoprotein n=1 Tax=Dyadobacter fermentans (strain ATCC 700827 / DSM 18053 / CIP 107007 / KCTC 52180 / NS114) TaxID=471854 RepID=C6VZF9_DYAFD|nr:BspA family leucine-rich repeat surface protein [Dyadobacter fermentans]ACT91771.1 lipoprotein [Dyadobacter fermentans DSM 18053]
MKTLYTILLVLLGQLALAQNEFITRWDLSVSGSGATQLSFNVATSGPVNYTWTEVSPGTATGSGAFEGATATITDLPAGATIELSIAPTHFKRIHINNGQDRKRLLDVVQWGTVSWASMNQAFYGCANLQISATDLPDLSGVTDMYRMFRGCSLLNGPANIGEWNTQNVTNMGAVFCEATAFNQPIGTWNTANATNLAGMFILARAFNQPIGSWNTSKVTDLTELFFGASAFNQPVGNWNVGTVFRMTYMFKDATSFNQTLGTWKLNRSAFLVSMLDNSGMDCYHYGETLIGWAQNPASPQGTLLSGIGRTYGSADAIAARKFLIEEKKWVIGGDAASGSECARPFVTRWDLARSGSGGTQLSFGVSTSGPVNFTWTAIGAGTPASGLGTFNDGTATITGLPAGATIELRIDPANFRRINIGNGPDKQRLNDIVRWGSAGWTSMENAFYGCTNLQISAPDMPDLSTVTSSAAMFRGCSALMGPADIGDWNTANVTDMTGMFQDAIAFNQSLGSWELDASVNLSNFLNNSGLSCLNYGETLKGWEANAATPPGRNLGAVGRTYGTEAENAREALVTVKGWTINGDGASGSECSGNFITQWDLSKTGSGDAQISFGVITSGPVGYTWTEISSGTPATGSGTFDNGTAIITGLPAGAMIKVSINPANFQGIAIANGQDKDRLVVVSSWGSTAWASMNAAFDGCTNLQITAIDLPNLSLVTSMASMFRGCAALNSVGNIGSWNVANVTDMSSLFEGASAFNQNIAGWNTGNVRRMDRMFERAGAFDQPIGTWHTGQVTDMHSMFENAASFKQSVGAWNTGNVTDMTAMFKGATAFNQPLGNWKLNAAVILANFLDDSGLNCINYGETLKGWAANAATPNGRNLGALNKTYGTESEDARAYLIATKGWTITDDVASGTNCSGAFVTRWDLSTGGSGTTQLSFEIGVAGTVSYTWKQISSGSSASGSGTFTTYNATITGLPAGATIELSILPTNFRRININNGQDKNRLVDIVNWGTTAWNAMNNAFYGCANLQISATDVPDLTNVQNMSQAFRGCAVLNGPANIGSWNTTSVTNMKGMFQEASAFNQNINNWNTANVSTMVSMFQDARAFNQPVDTWNIQNTGNINAIFKGASAFNQPIGNWNTRQVTDMSSAFEDASAFNQPIGTWDTGNVTLIYNIFKGASAFNQPIGAWNTQKVNLMSGMFNGASAFNQPIGTWNTESVWQMDNMFAGAIAFNQPIGTWNVGGVSTMAHMFDGATAFNQDIGGWNTQYVEQMEYMFYGASAFNQDISGWNIGWVWTMENMFNGASAFNQSLGDWTLGWSVGLTSIFTNSGMSCYAYTQTLKGWNDNPYTPHGIILDATGRTYSPSVVGARDNLITAKGWSISNDAASDTECSDGLPVTLVSFSGQKNSENQHVLKWTTASEVDFDHFEIQRSADARRFETIGMVPGKLAATPNVPAEYSFVDRATGSTSYYRLKMIDLDGSFAYSRIISIKNAGVQAFVGSFYPNPASGKVSIDVDALESGQWTVSVVDASGKSLSTSTYYLQKGKNTLRLDRSTTGLNLVRFEYGLLFEVRKFVGK